MFKRNLCIGLRWLILLYTVFYFFKYSKLCVILNTGIIKWSQSHCNLCT